MASTSTGRIDQRPERQWPRRRRGWRKYLRIASGVRMVSGCNAGMGQSRGIRSADPRSQGVSVRQDRHMLGGSSNVTGNMREDRCQGPTGMVHDAHTCKLAFSRTPWPCRIEEPLLNMAGCFGLLLLMMRGKAMVSAPLSLREVFSTASPAEKGHFMALSDTTLLVAVSHI